MSSRRSTLVGSRDLLGHAYRGKSRADSSAEFDLEPYESDLDYISDHLRFFEARVRLRNLARKIALGDLDEGENPAALHRLMVRWRTETETTAALIELRLEATETAEACLPKAEQIARQYELSPFEKQVILLLVGLEISKDFGRLLDETPYMCIRSNSLEVGDLLDLLLDTTEDRVTKRRCFYRDGALVRNHLIQIDSDSVFRRSLLREDVTIDPHLAGHLIGIDDECWSVADGSHLYRPHVSLDQVVLPAVEKDLIVRTVASFDAFRAECKRSGIDELLEYGGGLALLFHGPSGTGKTLMANALAAKLGRRVLLVNYPTLGIHADDVLRMLFREARVNDAVLFFDECESMLQSRDRGNSLMSLILTEIERHRGLVILATNRAFEIDEAVHRRITLAVEFRPPDVAERERIWRTHVPVGLRVECEPDFARLAFRYELTGGLIKNAVLAAVALATARTPDQPVVREADLEEGARLQMRGRLTGANLVDGVIPHCGLDDLVVPGAVASALEDLVHLEKARSTLSGDWGFRGTLDLGAGASALFHGSPGTGKSLAAEAIAYELGRPLKRVNLAAVGSPYVSEGAKNLEAVFRAAREHQAVLVFDEADAVFAGRTAVGNAAEREANREVAVLLREMESFPGVVVLTTNLLANIDPAFLRRLRFVIEFPMPDVLARLDLWRRHIPDRLPLSADVALEALATEFELSGALIRAAVLKAASRAALRSGLARCVRQADLIQAAREEAGSSVTTRAIGFRSLSPGIPSPAIASARACQ